MLVFRIFWFLYSLIMNCSAGNCKNIGHEKDK
jgi:hypothetical protein